MFSTPVLNTPRDVASALRLTQQTCTTQVTKHIFIQLCNPNVFRLNKYRQHPVQRTKSVQTNAAEIVSYKQE